MTQSRFPAEGPGGIGAFLEKLTDGKVRKVGDGADYEVVLSSELTIKVGADPAESAEEIRQNVRGTLEAVKALSKNKAVSDLADSKIKKLSEIP